MNNLFIPIFSSQPEIGHKPEDVLSLKEFLDLLREEEDYWDGDQNNTKLMISKLRKIFYDNWGWNSEAIRGAKAVEARYEALIVDDTSPTDKKKYKKLKYQPKHREVVYSKNDRVYGSSRAGKPTFIYANDHQEVRLPDGNLCDVAHILCGLDAWNHHAPVTPLPNSLLALDLISPHANSNMDFVTWLGDIASVAADWFFEFLLGDGQELSTEELQRHILIGAPGSDMLGNIDAYAIKAFYNISARKGMRVTEILHDFYFENTRLRENRIPIFCQSVGLLGWDGESFENEDQWLASFYKQLRDSTSFIIESLTNQRLSSVSLPLKVWIGKYHNVLKIEKLLEILLIALKKEMPK
ncbi:MAG: hypothetical protein JJU02_05960 [Cryomorphaceae bacterium]|nr:hypothetical protein [Cryomorphaceae bacterium]